LSDYFFGHFTNSLNLTETEGRAQLVSQAKPYLEKLPDSVFKEMMFARLKELSGLGTLDVLATTANRSPKPTLQKRPEPSGRMPLQRRTLALLIQHPELIGILEQRDIVWDGLKFDGIETFRRILQVILDEKPTNTGILLEYYRDHEDERIIRLLSDLQLGIPEGGEIADFSGTLDKLVEILTKAERRRLLDKLETEGLTPQEKEQLQNLSKAK